MRKIVAVIAVACALGAHAEERTVSTAQELYEAITALNSGPRLTPPNVIYLEPGDYVMVHAGVAIAKITEDDASETTNILNKHAR